MEQNNDDLKLLISITLLVCIVRNTKDAGVECVPSRSEEDVEADFRESPCKWPL